MKTRERTQSIWMQNLQSEYHSLTENISTECCVLGGGIAGLTTAYQLAKRGHKVVVVEAFEIGSGQTGRSTAQLTTQLEKSYTELLKLHDTKSVSDFYKAHCEAINEVETIIFNENISCDFKRLEGFLFKGKGTDQDFLLKEKANAYECGLDLLYVEKVPLLTHVAPGLLFSEQAQFNPLKFLHGLARVLKELDVQIFEGTHVHEIEPQGDKGVLLKTDREYEIRCQNLIVTTNTPVNNRYHLHTRQAPYRTYAMAFEMDRDIQDECLMWDTEEPYHYVRFSNELLIVGGEDHKTGHEPDGDPFLKLEKWTRLNFPFIGKTREKWSGQVFEPMDGLPFIGKNPGVEKNVYISTGSSGIGITTGVIASMMIPDLIEKGDHPYKELFSPSRNPLPGLMDFVQENLDSAMQYLDWLKPSEVKEVDLIPLDKGNILSDGVKKSCVYHAQDDHFEECSAVCPHLGGIVHWNDVEKTWDCPLHGSRFTTMGTVIEGPALDNLPEV